MAPSEYYAITLTASTKGAIQFGTQTRWAGWTDVGKRHELRVARTVYREFAKLWESVRQPYRIVTNIDELGPFLVEGGNALVEKDLAERIFGLYLSHPEESISLLEHGFKSKASIPKALFNRAPTPKLRMEVLKRDGRKCRVCGRAPESHSDIELHVHHIWPWAQGGLTELGNLITLCQTCHIGLDPHFDRSLYEYVKPSVSDAIEEALLEHLQGVAEFRRRGGMMGEP